jgi:hypothetical protein
MCRQIGYSRSEMMDFPPFATRTQNYNENRSGARAPCRCCLFCRKRRIQYRAQSLHVYPRVPARVASSDRPATRPFLPASAGLPISAVAGIPGVTLHNSEWLCLPLRAIARSCSSPIKVSFTVVADTNAYVPSNCVLAAGGDAVCASAAASRPKNPMVHNHMISFRMCLPSV